MQARGYSLIEMILVIGIVSILIAIGTLQFNVYARRYKGEAQTRMIYSELLKARANALYERRVILVKMYRSRFEVYSSVADNEDGVAPVRALALGFPITCNGRGDEVKGYRIGFDARGHADDSDLCSICVDNGDGSGVVDSVVVSKIRVGIGKKDKGDECRRENITLR